MVGKNKGGRPKGTKDRRPRPKTGGNLRGGIRQLTPTEQRVIKAIRHITVKQVAELASLIITSDMDELGRIAEKKCDGDGMPPSVLQVWYANIAVKSIEDGDVYALNAVLDRIIGRVKEHIEISTPDSSPILVSLSSMSSEERLAEIERLRGQRLAAGDD